jgi:hypothetical protein
MACDHENFRAQVNVHRMNDIEGGPITGYMSEITISCAQCGIPFEFLGLEPGIDTHGARTCLEGIEARIALSPQGAKPNPLQRMALNVSKFDG